MYKNPSTMSWQMWWDRSMLQQGMPALELPAAATTVAPSAMTACTAASMVVSIPVAPRDMDTTAGSCRLAATQSRAAMTADACPAPLQSIHRTAQEMPSDNTAIQLVGACVFRLS